MLLLFLFLVHVAFVLLLLARLNRRPAGRREGRASAEYDPRNTFSILLPTSPVCGPFPHHIQIALLADCVRIVPSSLLPAPMADRMGPKDTSDNLLVPFTLSRLNINRRYGH